MVPEGNDFGGMGSFGSANTPHHGPSHGAGHSSQLNAESLAPEGVFLPPLPTAVTLFLRISPISHPLASFLDILK